MDQASSVPKSIEQFQFQFKDAPKSTCDSAYIIFEEFILEVLEQVEFDYKKIMGLQNPSNAQDYQEATYYIYWLKENGFSYKETKDDVIILPNVAEIKKKVYPYLSEELQLYFAKVEEEAKQGFAINDSLIISPSMLAMRCLYWEDFIYKHPDFIMMQEVKQRYNAYLEALIFGTSKTSLFSGKKKKLRSDFKNAYSFVLKNHPFSYTGDILERYVHILNKHEFKENTEAEMFTWKNL